MKRPLVLHPFLLAVFPILALLAQNLEWVPISNAVRALIVVLAGALALLGLSWIVLRDLPRAGLITSLVLLLFFTYGHIYGSLKIAGHGATFARHRFLAPVALALFLGAAFWIVKYLRDPKPATRVLNVIAVVLLILPIFTIVSYQARPSQQSQTESQVLHLPPGEKPPDIYYIVVDGYGRKDTLKEVYELENEPFLQMLEEAGFYVATAARANYAQTSLALAAALNLDYVDALVPELDYGRDPLWDLIKDSEARRQLEALGYETVAFATGLEGTEWYDADHYLSPSTLNEVTGTNAFESMLADTTALRMVTDGAVALPRMVPVLDYPYEAHRTRLLHTLDGLTNLPPSDRPRLIFAHLILPHPPFVFDAEGDPLTPDAPFSLDFPSGASEEEYIKGYRAQVQFLNRELERIIPEILARSEIVPVIIIQADHGPDSNSGRQNYVQERMTILNAILMPGGQDMLYPHLTPVNTFRMIFNQVFGGDYERLPDRALFSEYGAPFEFIDVTGGVERP